MEPPLTALDRCDQCSAQAYIRMTKPEVGQLLFCGHHGKGLLGPMTEKGWKVESDLPALEREEQTHG